MITDEKTEGNRKEEMQHNTDGTNSGRRYFALIGDIIDSRHEENRFEVQNKLQAVLSAVNNEQAEHIAADFLITLGDEFQGLMYAEAGANPIFTADRIIDEMYPVRIRISIGYGAIATQIRREAAIGADGEAFYRARRGMNLLRAAEKRGRAGSRILLEACGTEECNCCDGKHAAELETGVNAVLLLLATLRRSRTARQNAAAAMYVRNAVTGSGQTQTELAQRLGITQSTFNISLSVSNAREYAEGLIAAETLLSGLKTGNSATDADNEDLRKL